MLKLLKASWENFKTNPMLWLVVWWLFVAIVSNLYMHDGSLVW